MEPRKGTLYFISESDLLTGKGTGYFKIGLVNDSRLGGSTERAGEHQTGNPRKLDVYAEVTSAAIRELETLMHSLWAPSRILGEWFTFTPRELSKAVLTAEDYATQQSAIEGDMEKSKKNAAMLSNGKSRKPTTEEIEILREYKQAVFELAAIKKVFDAEATLFRRLLDEAPDIAGTYAWRAPDGSEKFDAVRFKKVHPDLYEHYSESVTRPVGRVSITKPKSGEGSLPRPLVKLLSEQESALATVGRKPGDSLLREIHLRHLAIRSLYGDSSWREGVAAVQIKAACGKYDSIDGVIKWARGMSETSSFSSTLLKKENPALYQRFCTKKVSPKFEIKNLRAYP